MTPQQQAIRKEFKSHAAQMKNVKSDGHISWDGDYELYQVYGNVYRAHYTNTIDIVTGNRIGRWERKV